MRRIIGYDADRRAIWSENIPAENVGWGHALGGRAIEERVIPRGEPTSVKHLKQKLGRLRGAALFDPETGAWKK